MAHLGGAGPRRRAARGRDRRAAALSPCAITFVYAGLNRLIRETGGEMLLVTGRGHDPPANPTCPSPGCASSTSSTSSCCRAPTGIPHGMTREDFEARFGVDVPVVFDVHGYPQAVHRCLHGRERPARLHVTWIAAWSWS